MTVKTFMFILVLVYLAAVAVIIFATDMIGNPNTKWFILSLGALGFIALLMEKFIRHPGKKK